MFWNNDIFAFISSALVWQMLRDYTIQVLASLTKQDGHKVKDSEIVNWVNNKVRAFNSFLYIIGVSKENTHLLR